MKRLEEQIVLDQVDDEYKAFVDKFKPKKTTDDCYTPENVYEAVENWACREYGIDESRIVRPFYPGGDYERYPYKDGDVVLDNPPFSIIAKIVRYYNEREIPFFLFAPYLTNFSSGMSASHIVTDCVITYENGAKVNTSFLTNMDGHFIRSTPDLRDQLNAADAENTKLLKKQLPKYVYPDEVLMVSDVGYMCKHGIDFSLEKEDCFFIRQLDSQKAKGKTLFGGGFLLSERAAAERAAAERAAAERAAAERWELSERELDIVKSLGFKNQEEQSND